MHASSALPTENVIIKLNIIIYYKSNILTFNTEFPVYNYYNYLLSFN